MKVQYNSSSTISTHQACFVRSTTAAMEHWTDSKVIELQPIQGEKEIEKQIIDMVKDTMMYDNITRLLNKAYNALKNKLNALKKQYIKVHDHSKNKSGIGRKDG